MLEIFKRSHVMTRLLILLVTLIAVVGTIAITHHPVVTCASVTTDSVSNSDARVPLYKLTSSSGKKYGTNCEIKYLSEWDGWHQAVFKLPITDTGSITAKTGWREIPTGCRAADKATTMTFPNTVNTRRTAYTYSGSDNGCNVPRGTTALIVTHDAVYLYYISAY